MKNSKQVRKSDEQQKGAGGVSAVKAATTSVIMNPQAVQRAAEFVAGFPTEMGPPPPSPAGYLGAAANAAYGYVKDLSSAWTKTGK